MSNVLQNLNNCAAGVEVSAAGVDICAAGVEKRITSILQMKKPKPTKALKMCSLCGIDVGMNPGRHMSRHHPGKVFKALRDGEEIVKKLDKKIFKGK